VAQVSSTEVVLAARCRRKYANAHTYHVNSIALSSDQETFITADDLRVNLWHLDISDQAFNVVDMKPANMDELTEVWFPELPASPGVQFSAMPCDALGM
jgi:serine/threonine-protein phosphatase 2A regulatory subunit B